MFILSIDHCHAKNEILFHHVCKERVIEKLMANFLENNCFDIFSNFPENEEGYQKDPKSYFEKYFSQRWNLDGELIDLAWYDRNLSSDETQSFYHDLMRICPDEIPYEITEISDEKFDKWLQRRVEYRKIAKLTEDLENEIFHDNYENSHDYLDENF